MKIFEVFKQDFRYFWKQPMLIITFIAIACLPFLYSSVLIKGNWDPYSKLENMPIAVVNEDKGADFDEGRMTIGNEFVNELEKNRTFDWHFVNADEANLGIDANEYYAKLTIPDNFSVRAASLITDDPEQAELLYEVNSNSNFIAGQISENALKELRQKLSKTLTETYATSVLERFSNLSSGLKQAGDGANELNAGSIVLNNGVHELQTHLDELSTGAKNLGDGVSILKNGSSRIEEGTHQVSKGAARLSDSLKQWSSAFVKLEEGMYHGAIGVNNLVTGIRNSTEGVSKLNENMESISVVTQHLHEGISASTAQTKHLAESYAQWISELQKILKSDSVLNTNSELQNLLSSSTFLTKEAENLSVLQSKLAIESENLTIVQKAVFQGTLQMEKSQEQLHKGAVELQSGQQNLINGFNRLNTNVPELIAGGRQLAESAAQVSEGAHQFTTSLEKLETSVTNFSYGADMLVDGALKLSEGSVKLVAGTSELAKGLDDAAIKTSVLNADKKTVQLFAEPVVMKSNEDHKVSLYAAGVAPYFLSLAFLAGALVVSTTFSARNSSVPNASGSMLFVSKILLFGILSLAQSLIASTVMLFVVGLEVQSYFMFYIYSIIVSFAFMFFVQMCVTLIGKPGQFLALIIMILQLVSSAGTFPYELQPDWAQALYPWMPMTYTVQGYRDVISSGNYTHMWSQVGFLSIYIALSIGLIWLYFQKSSKKIYKVSEKVISG